MKSVLSFLFFIALLTACTSHKKKILIYANSNVQVDEAQKHISVKAGTTHVEKELVYSGSEPVEIEVTGPTGTQKFEPKEDAYYLINLKADTVVGSMQHVGKDAATEVSQVQVKANIDSLGKLIRNQNVSSKGKNYFVAPGQMVKITTYPDAKIFGPFTTIPSSFDAGSVPEVYKFYNVSEVREIIGKLTQMTKYKGNGGDDDEDDDAK